MESDTTTRFITTYAFKVQIAKAELIAFISKIPSELFLFLVTDEPIVYGMFVSDEALEFFTNEFTIQSLEMVSEQVLVSKLQVKHCKVWGNKELLYLNT